MNHWQRRGFRSLLLFMPFFLLFLLFIIYPMISTVFRSFIGGKHLFSNYEALFVREDFRFAALSTLGYTAASGVLVILLAFPVTFLIHNAIRNHPFIKHLLSLPYLTSIMSISLIGLMLFSREAGMANKILPLFGLTPQSWLDEPGKAFLCVLSLLVWRSFSYTVFSFLNALESLPVKALEVARIYGATPWQTFTSITLPHAVPNLMYIIPTTIISSVTLFEQLCVLYIGGMEETVGSSLPVVLFHLALSENNAGVTCALGTLLIIPVLIICVIYARYTLKSHTYVR